MEYEVEGPRTRGRPKRTWREVVKEDCQARKLNTEDAMDRKWRKLIKDVRWSGWVWVGECFFWYRPTRVVPDQQPLNGHVCVCICVLFHAFRKNTFMRMWIIISCFYRTDILPITQWAVSTHWRVALTLARKYHPLALSLLFCRHIPLFLLVI